jgi:phosphate/sulfate permease
MIIAALAGAIVWNLITWRAGLPSSSSHALIGGLIGMGLVGYGVHAVQWAKVGPVVVALITSPLVGMMGAGATRRLAAVRWGVARRILVARVLTIPAAALVAGASH